MKASKNKFILLPLLTFLLSTAYADEMQDLQIKINQAKVLFDQIQKDIDQITQKKVYLGAAQASMHFSNDSLNYYISNITINNITDVLNKLNELNKLNKSIPSLQWLSVSNTAIPSSNLINAGLANEKINICRAAFIGAQAQSQAMYPGQLTAAGCRISYAGYAFIMQKFALLSGTDKGLQWIPIATVKSNITQPLGNNNTSNVESRKHEKQIPDMTPLSGSTGVSFLGDNQLDFNMTINGAMTVAGGYEGGNPVLICRTMQNNATVIGKLVQFVGVNGQLQNACDIGMNEKEITIMDNYDLLFWKKP